MLQRAWPTWPHPGLARLARLAWLACLLCNDAALANSFEPGQSDKEILDILAHHNRLYPPNIAVQYLIYQLFWTCTGLGLGWAVQNELIQVRQAHQAAGGPD